MSDPEVRESTASEPLSLQEEFEMQGKSFDASAPCGESWRVDEDKMTFIILKQANPPLTQTTATAERLRQHDVAASMIGDINVFLSTAYSSDEHDSDDNADRPDSSTPERKPDTSEHRRCELEIMVPLAASQRQGYAHEALRIFIAYVSETLKLPPTAFFARIGTSNSRSLQLFENKLGFQRGKTSVFNEIEMTYGAEEWKWPVLSAVRLDYPAFAHFAATPAS